MFGCLVGGGVRAGRVGRRTDWLAHSVCMALGGFERVEGGGETEGEAGRGREGREEEEEEGACEKEGASR